MRNMPDNLRMVLALEIKKAGGVPTSERMEFALRLFLESSNLLLESVPKDLFISVRNYRAISGTVRRDLRAKLGEFIKTGKESSLSVVSDELRCICTIGKAAI
jgi:hypothetical protein